MMFKKNNLLVVVGGALALLSSSSFPIHYCDAAETNNLRGLGDIAIDTRAVDDAAADFVAVANGNAPADGDGAGDGLLSVVSTDNIEELDELLPDDAVIPSSRGLCACSWRNMGCCVSNPGGIGERERLGQYVISVKNKCSKKIWVGIHYREYYSGEDSCVGGGCGGPKWVSRGYWSLDFWETKAIAVTKNRIVYFTAYTEDGDSWGGDFVQEINDKNRKFFKTTLPNSFTRVTQEFSC